MKLIGIGDNVVDRYIDRRIMFPGGNAVNFAVYAKELGQDSAYMGIIADDIEGDLIADSLTEIGVDISPSEREKGAGTERCDVELRDGDRVFVGTNTGGREHVNLTLTSERLGTLQNYDLIHCGCYAEMEDEISKLKDTRAIMTFDFSEEDEYKEDDYLAKVCPYIDIALFSASDIPEYEMQSLRDKCFELGAKMIMMTKGSDGQIFYTKDGEYEGTVKFVTPVDTMGAGDSFFAAFIVTLLENGLKKNEVPTSEMIAKALERAAEFSAQNCMREGAFGFATKY